MCGIVRAFEYVFKHKTKISLRNHEVSTNDAINDHFTLKNWVVAQSMILLTNFML